MALRIPTPVGYQESQFKVALYKNKATTAIRTNTTKIETTLKLTSLLNLIH